MKRIASRVVLVVLALAVVVGLGLVRAKRVKQLKTAPTIQPAVSSVQVAEVHEGQVAAEINEQGIVNAKTESVIASQVMARCVAVYKREGDAIHAGEVIARLDDRELRDVLAAKTAEALAAQAASRAQTAEVAGAREDAAARAADVTGAEATVAASLAGVDAARQAAAAQMAQVDAARATLASQRAAIDGAKQTVAAQQAAVEAARQTVAAEQATVEQAKEKLAAAEVAASTQRSRTARDKVLYENKAISQEQWEASQTAQAQTEAAVGALKRQIEALSRGVESAQARVDSLLRGVEASKQQVASLTAVAQAQEQRVVSLQHSAEAAQKQTASAQHSVEVARQHVAALKATQSKAEQHVVAQQNTAAASADSAKALAGTAAASQTRLAYTVIRAPYDALVTARLAEPGNLLAPGQPLYRVLKPGSVKVVVNVPQESLALVRIGSPVRLTADDQSMEAAVSRVYPALTGGRLGSFEVELPKAPFGLKSGATLMVALRVRSQRGLVVPTGALLESERGQFVYVVKKGAVKCEPVQVKARNGEEAVVSGEVLPGDLVVVAQPSQLMTFHDGQRVKPLHPKHPGGQPQ